MTKVDENMQQAKKMLDTIVERDYELQKEVWKWRTECHILEEENKKLKEDVEFFRQCYLDLKKLCEDGWFLLSDEEVAKMFNLDEIK